jgi:hypothetical protein
MKEKNRVIKIDHEIAEASGHLSSVHNEAIASVDRVLQVASLLVSKHFEQASNPDRVIHVAELILCETDRIQQGFDDDECHDECDDDEEED